MIFEEMDVWFDPAARVGPEAMAVDEWLLGKVRKPLLRIYEWDGEWGSLGYFSKLEEARENFPGLEFVRRWTGGGVVDHRRDWTYSLVVPDEKGGRKMRRGESYRAVHRVLSGVLRREGLESGLAGRTDAAGGVCFENLVEYDVMDKGGAKVAGAAQRRGQRGLLHQGSVAGASVGKKRGLALAEGLAGRWEEAMVELSEEDLIDLTTEKYGSKSWLERC